MREPAERRTVRGQVHDEGRVHSCDERTKRTSRVEPLNPPFRIPELIAPLVVADEERDAFEMERAVDSGRDERDDFTGAVRLLAAVHQFDEDSARVVVFAEEAPVDGLQQRASPEDTPAASSRKAAGPGEPPSSSPSGRVRLRYPIKRSPARRAAIRQRTVYLASAYCTACRMTKRTSST